MSFFEIPDPTIFLNPAKAARIRYSTTDPVMPSRLGRPPVSVPNSLQEYMLGFEGWQDTSIEDVLVGACRSIPAGRGISPSMLFAILQCMEQVSAPEIQRMLNCSPATAKWYMQAFRGCLAVIQPRISRRVL